MTDFCMCGAQAFYSHATDCPYPYYGSDPRQEGIWLVARDVIRTRAGKTTTTAKDLDLIASFDVPEKATQLWRYAADRGVTLHLITRKGRFHCYAHPAEAHAARILYTRVLSDPTEARALTTF